MSAMRSLLGSWCCLCWPIPTTLHLPSDARSAAGCPWLWSHVILARVCRSSTDAILAHVGRTTSTTRSAYLRDDPEKCSGAHPRPLYGCLGDRCRSGIQEVKGKPICIVDFTAIQNSVAARFIICEGQSNTQVEAIARSVEEFTEKMHERVPLDEAGFEGRSMGACWIMLMWSSTSFHKDWRVHYGLEELWADAPQQVLPDLEDAQARSGRFSGILIN